MVASVPMHLATCSKTCSHPHTVLQLGSGSSQSVARPVAICGSRIEPRDLRLCNRAVSPAYSSLAAGPASNPSRKSLIPWITSLGSSASHLLHLRDARTKEMYTNASEWSDSSHSRDAEHMCFANSRHNAGHRRIP